MSANVPKPPSALRGAALMLSRVLGLCLILVSLVAYWECLRTLDRRDYVSAMLAGFVGWFVTQAGIELVRPETAE